MRTFLALLVGLLLAGNVSAQERRRPQGQREKLPKEAKLLGAAPGVIKVQTEDGKQWLVGLGRTAQTVSIVGKADATWLQPGMLVRFSARFDRRGEAIAPIQDISVVTLREGMRFGMTPENLPTPGLGSGAAGGLFKDAAEEQSAARKKPRRQPKPKPQDISYTVIGKIAKVRKGDLSIAAGRLLKAKLAEQPRISVDVSDLSLAPMGTTISLDAWYYPNMPGRAMATRVTIALEKTLEGKKRVLPGQPAASGDSAKPKAGDKKDPFGLGGKDPFGDGKKDGKKEGEKDGKDGEDS